MIFEKILLSKLDKFKELGVLDEENSLRLENHLNEKLSKTSSAFWGIFYIFGTLMFALSAYLVVYYYWFGFSKDTKLFFAFVPFILSGIFGAVVLKLRLKECWKEGASLAFCASFAILISLIASILHYIGDTFDYGILVGAFAVSMAFCFRSAIACCFCAIVLAACIPSRYSTSLADISSFKYALSCVEMLAVFALLNNLYKPSNIFKNIALAVFALPFFAFSMEMCYLFFENRNGDISFVFCGILAPIFVLRSKDVFGNFTARNMNFIVGLVVIFIMLAAIFGGEVRGYVGEIFSDFNAHKAILFTYIFAGLAYLVYLAVKEILNKNRSIPALWLIMILPLSVVTLLTNEDSLVCVVLANLFMFIAGLMFALDGLNKKDFWTLNVGIAIVIMQIIYRISFASYSILTNALLIFIAGAIFVGLNVLLRKRFK